ncbi:MAG: head-tail adaptor protein [Gammaproteobacteria bacterium]|nr:MAG: head-tail adaptor protein [Gammaproteobacteria bacterium]
MSVRAGRLKDQVEIQTKSVAKNALQEDVVSWSSGSPQLLRRCSIEPLNGREFFAAQGESTEVSVRIRFHYEAGLLSTAKRLVNNLVSPEVTYDIESVIDPGNEHRELIAMCVVRD